MMAEENENPVEKYEEDAHGFILKSLRRPSIVSDCCGAEVDLINPHVRETESVYCSACGKACNAVSEQE